MKVMGNATEDGIVVGNIYNKYETTNLIARRLLDGFEKSLLSLVARATPSTIHEVGCGEGYWTLKLKSLGYSVTGSDFSTLAIAEAKKNAGEEQADTFFVSDIASHHPKQEADLILACEVLEHLPKPEKALAALEKMANLWLLCSVPREPYWGFLNMCRGKYWKKLGNTPGHLQRWTKNAFLELLKEFFTIVEVRLPLPWTMALCRTRTSENAEKSC